MHPHLATQYLVGRQLMKQRASQENERISSLVEANKLISRAHKKIEHFVRQPYGYAIRFIRRGPETVLIVPPIARGGNWLYEWMKAYSQQNSTGEKVQITFRAGMEPWIKEFPLLQMLTIKDEDIRFRSLRQIGVNPRINENFAPLEISRFISEVLLTSPLFSESRKHALEVVTPTSLVINVRRGDYYSNPHIKYQFGIDTVRYIRKALEQLLNDFQPTQIILVSDDLDWCTEHLDFLTNIAPTRFAKIGKTMFDDLAVLSVASNLILTNTTFGYWGAYIASKERNARVLAPNVHERSTQHERVPPQHLKGWISIEPDAGSWLD